MDEVEIGLRELGMEEKIVCHGNNAERGAAGLRGFVERSFEVRTSTKGFEVLGPGGDKLAEHFVKQHGNAAGIPNSACFQTDLNIFNKLRACRSLPSTLPLKKQSQFWASSLQ